MGQYEKKEAMRSAPSALESHRWCMQGKQASPTPSSIKLVWLCPVLPWQVKEG